MQTSTGPSKLLTGAWQSCDLTRKPGVEKQRCQVPLDASSPRTHSVSRPRRCTIPIYEFSCEACGNEFEQLVFKTGEEVPCPECESSDVRRKMSAFAIKSGSKFVAANGSSCGSCSPGPGGCSSCGH